MTLIGYILYLHLFLTNTASHRVHVGYAFALRYLYPFYFPRSLWSRVVTPIGRRTLLITSTLT
jgi:hypothetical protein